jgi:hypothetical protein
MPGALVDLVDIDRQPRACDVKESHDGGVRLTRPDPALREIVAAVRASPATAVTALFVGESEAVFKAASVVAGSLGREVRRADLGRVVGRFIGETEKNLDRVFADAEGQGVVLYFDEADALFGKRTGITSAHDRYANIETADLLSRMERFQGLAILATNRRQQIDAVRRRLRYFVELPAGARVE